MNYRFGKTAAGAGSVPAACLYKPGKQSYGFLTEENRKEYQSLQIAELNSGYDTVYWAKNSFQTCIEEDEEGCFVVWDRIGEVPLTFVCEVPAEGNYKVDVSVYAKSDTELLLFLGRRRLAARKKMAAGEHWTGSFVTNICPIIPRTYTDAMDDLTLDVTLVGASVCLCEVCVNEWQGPTLYIAGDSTVTDQSADYPYLPGNSYSGWGQMLSAYVGASLAVSNHAHSGLTTESFRSEGHYDILQERIQAGDICLIQFGHNDQKLSHLLAEGGYKENLMRYIDEIKAKGAYPVIVTPLARNSWMGGSGAYNDLLEGYEKVCQEVGKACDIPVLELHKKSMAFVKAQGRESAKRYFFPSDYTHSNDYGAYLFAGYIYEELCEKGVLTTAGVDVANLQQPTEWMAPEVLPELEIPEECRMMENPATEHLFENLERPDEVLTRADALEFIVTTMHFFPTNVYNDMFTDVIGHETYAGTVECAWQNGLIPESLIENHTLQPMREVSIETFVELLLNGYATRKDLPEGETALIQAQRLGIVDEAADSSKLITREQAAQMCRQLKI